MTDIQKRIAREIAEKSPVAARIYFAGAVHVDDIGVPSLFTLLATAYTYDSKDEFTFIDGDKTIIAVRDFNTKDAWESIGSSVLKEAHVWAEGVLGIENMELNEWGIIDAIHRAISTRAYGSDRMLVPTKVLPSYSAHRAYTMFLLGLFPMARVPPGHFFCLPEVRNAIRSGVFREATTEEHNYVRNAISLENCVDIVDYFVRKC